MKKVYQTPTLKVVEFKVERGFQASGPVSSFTKNDGEFDMLFDINDGPRNEQNDYINEGNTFWN